MNLLELEQIILGDVWTSPTLRSSLQVLCDECNGRFAGSADERRAGDYLLERFRGMRLDNVHAESFDMRGWVRGPGQLTLIQGEMEHDLPCMPLAGSPPGQVQADVVDIGPGTPADLERLSDAVKGQIVLASDQGPHRLEKYTLAYQAGAIGFLFACSRPGALIPAGSLGMGDEAAPLPGVGLSMETTALLRRQLERGRVQARLTTQCQVQPVTARNIVAELPGSDPDAGWIVVCGHYDGHDIAQAAQDNATGTALVLESARLLARLRSHLKASLRFVLFSGEEMGMFGSENYVRVHADELDRVRTVFNADVVGLAAPLMLMVQNSPELASYLRELALAALDAQVVEGRLVPYSDHFPFTLAGVPSLMAATSSPGKGHGWAHTAADTLDKIEFRPLYEAVASAGRILLRMAVEPAKLATKRQAPDQVKQVLIDAGWEQPLRLQRRWPF